jgi:hypothetical protein
VHSRYHRRPADLPSLGRAVSVRPTVHRFYCRNGACARRTFAERLPDLVAPSDAARIGWPRRRAEPVWPCGQAGARLLSRRSMPASAATVLRLAGRTPPPDRASPPRVIGVDDWAKRKGARLRHDRRGPGAAPGRRSPSRPFRGHARPLAAERSEIEGIARDRSTEYASGIALGAPMAILVADRWHLLSNMRQAVERCLADAHGRLRDLPVPRDDSVPSWRQRTEPFPRADVDERALLDSRARQLALYEEVRRRHAGGEPLLAIARATSLARDGPQIRPGPGLPGAGPASRQLQYRRCASSSFVGAADRGCADAATLWREVKALGYADGHHQVRRRLTERRTELARTAPRRWRGLGRMLHAPPGFIATAAHAPATRVVDHATSRDADTGRWMPR